MFIGLSILAVVVASTLFGAGVQTWRTERRERRERQEDEARATARSLREIADENRRIKAAIRSMQTRVTTPQPVPVARQIPSVVGPAYPDLSRYMTRPDKLPDATVPDSPSSTEHGLLVPAPAATVELRPKDRDS